MYTYEEWEKQSAEVRSHLNFLIRDHAAFWREYMRDRAIVEPDGKLGRISIPRKLLEAIGVQKEVVFAGNATKSKSGPRRNSRLPDFQKTTT